MVAHRNNPSKGLPPKGTEKVGTSTVQSSEEVKKQQIECLSKTLELYRKSEASSTASQNAPMINPAKGVMARLG